MIALALASLLFASPNEPAPDGVFQSRGYGWIIERTAGEFRLYHRAGEDCWLDPEGGDLAEIFAESRPRADGGIGLTEASDDQATVYVFDPLPGLPDACTAADAGDRAAVVAIADLMQAYYPGFEARGVPFATRRAEVLDALPADASSTQAFAAAEALLAGLDDPHLELSAEIEGEEHALAVSQGPTLDAVMARPGERPERAWLAAWRSGIEQTILGGQGQVAANNRVFWGLRSGVGYLAVVTMGGFNPEDDADVEPLEQALDQAMTAFQGARAVVVDVSNNRGGYDGVGRRIAARFADQPHVAYRKWARNAVVEPQTISVTPSERPRYTGPVWLLTSDITVSAGETFTQMMLALPTVTHAGTATRGALSDQTPVTLANGWIFAMPMEDYATPDGRMMEGRPIVPAIVIDLYPADDLDQGHARAVAALMDRLGR